MKESANRAGDNGIRTASALTSGEYLARMGRIPSHIAVIMDGNGRWAESRGLKRIEGHRHGVKRVRAVVEECRKLGVGTLSLFCFSTENWQRPSEEVGALMQLFSEYLKREIDSLKDNGIRLRVMGDLTRLPVGLADMVEKYQERTACCRDMNLILAVSYGGRSEITSAVRKIVSDVQSGKLNLSSGKLEELITEELISSCLYAPDVPDPELLIRTSNEHRISNFMLWQLAYSEIVVSKVNWPEFTVEEFYRCLTEFAGRKRRFGLTQEQIEA